MKKLLNIANILIVILVFSVVRVQAQSRKTDSTLKSIAIGNIPASRLAKINAAFSYDHQTYLTIISDASLNPVEKNLQLKAFMNARQRRIDSLVTTAEKAKIQLLKVNILKRDSLRCEANFIKNIEKLNKIPHRTRSDSRGNKNIKENNY